MSRAFDYIDQAEQKRLLKHFYCCLEQVIRDNNLMRYNQPTNILYDVYKIVSNKAKLMLLPSDMDDNLNKMYEYNVFQVDNEQDRLILAYVQEHFDKLVG